ncbi:50S ribosomal protein L18 [Candidatus Burarchaeum australiense]|nr:50S ribosomal protein L18 [Candidatus Burarchaeum australiense]
MARATGPIYSVKFRRRRENKTNYARRLALLKSGKTRLVIRSTNRQVLVQFVNFGEKGDMTLCSANSSALEKFNWKPKRNLPTAYLTGMLAGKIAVRKGVKDAILDSGLSTPTKSSVLFSALQGVVDAGVTVPHGEGLVDEKRLKGAHIDAYAKSKGGPGSLEAEFEKVKKAVMEAGG